MSNLYKKIDSLCQEKGITGAKLCTDTGISKGLITDLKMGRRTGVSAVTAQKIASYFGVTVGYLLGEEDKIKNSPDVEENTSREDLEILSIISNLSEEKRKEFVRYLKYLANS